MNLVRLQPKGGGSDIEPYTVIVTLDEDFAGQVVTLSQDGQDSLTKTCPSVEPFEVTFKPMYSGIWTVTSTTIDGKLSTNVTDSLLEWGTYTVELKSGFNFEEWLTRGRVEETYSSLEEILEDEKTIRQLFTVHDSVDYLCENCASNEDLARQVLSNDLVAKWVNLRDYALDTLWANATVKAIMDDIDKYGYGEWALVGQVPKMTDNTAPYGEAFASGEYDNNFKAWKAFNNDKTGNPWLSKNEKINAIGYKFEKPTRINSIYIYQDNTATTSLQYLDNFEIQATNTNDWSNPTVLYSGSFDRPADDTIYFDNDNDYLYYRLVNSSSAEKYIRIYVLQFYAWQPKGNVPVMTGANTPYGTVSRSSIYTRSASSAYVEAFNAFSQTSEYWGSNSPNAGEYLGYKFTNPIILKAFSMKLILQGHNMDFGTIKYEVRGSNDGFVNSNDLLYSQTDETLREYDYIKIPENNTPYIEYRIVGIKAYSTFYFGLSNVQFYGRELKVSVPKMSVDNYTPWGEASADGWYNGQYGNYPPYLAFNGNTGANQNWVSDNKPNGYIQYKFEKPMVIKAFAECFSENNNEIIKDYVLLASNDNFVNDTNEIKRGTLERTTSLQVVNVTNEKAYQYYRLVAENTYWGNQGNVCVSILNFYGLDYSEREFEPNSNMKYIYDHGVELEELYLQSATYTKVGSINIGDGQNCKPTLYIKNPIDFSPYNIMRATSGLNWYNNYASRQNMITLGMASTSYQWEGYRDCGALDLYHDVRNIMEEKSAFFGWGANAIINMDITEWWLE